MRKFKAPKKIRMAATKAKTKVKSNDAEILIVASLDFTFVLAFVASHVV